MDALKNDMFLPHEGIPAGLPDAANWKFKPRLNLGTNLPKNWNCITGWGQVYADREQPCPDKDFPQARVQIKDLNVYIYQTDGTWKIIQQTKVVDGAAYREDFVEDINKPAEIRYEKEGISIQAGSGYNFHFFPKEKTMLHSKDIAGVFVSCRARLIGAEHYENPPKYMMSIGADYWRSLTAEWKSDYSNNSDVGIGRFKYVTPEWQCFTMHTFSQEEMKNIVFPEV
jgi:hypothetical protein